MTEDSSAAPLRVGVIGCGALGKVHVKRFHGMEGVDVAALSDPNGERLAECAALCGDRLPVQVSRYSELLDAGLDAVCIASPDSLHVEQVLAALDRGLHVLCEKPLTLEPAELQAVLDARDRAGKHVAMTYPRRYSGGIRAMRREILSGKWGRVQTVTAYNAEDWVTPNVGQWRHDPKLCPGGFFHDASGHQLDTLLWLTGLQPEWVQAQVSNRGTAVPIVVWGNARLSGDVPLIFTFIGDAQVWREQLNIHCEGRDFVIENGRTFWNAERKVEPLEPSEPTESAEEVFLRLLREGGTNWAPPDAIWPLLNLTRTALESAERGMGLEVNPS